MRYISRTGHTRLLAELNQLQHEERPKIVQEVADAAAQGDRSENAEYIYGKKRLREIDRRTRWLQKRLADMQVIDVDQPRGPRCFFGAWVIIEDEHGAEKTFRILGEDEVNASLGLISYVSPLGKALLKKEEGDIVTVDSPSGLREYSLLCVHYGPEAPKTGRPS
jgi:transcription elongation factor GreB